MTEHSIRCYKCNMEFVVDDRSKSIRDGLNYSGIVSMTWKYNIYWGG